MLIIHFSIVGCKLYKNLLPWELISISERLESDDKFVCKPEFDSPELFCVICNFSFSYSIGLDSVAIISRICTSKSDKFLKMIVEQYMYGLFHTRLKCLQILV